TSARYSTAARTGPIRSSAASPWNLWPKRSCPPSTRKYADQIRASARCRATLTSAKPEHSGTNLPESAQRVPEFIPKCSPHVRANREWQRSRVSANGARNDFTMPVAKIPVCRWGERWGRTQKRSRSADGKGKGKVVRLLGSIALEPERATLAVVAGAVTEIGFLRAVEVLAPSGL